MSPGRLPNFTSLTVGFLVSTSPIMATAASPAPRPLAEAAQISLKSLPKNQGIIVTAETEGDQPTVTSLAGTSPPKNVPPEKILFEIGSITKVFTGLLLAQAVAEGKTTLDTSLKRVFGIKQEFADPRVGEITLKQLATHTSGLPRLPANLDVGADPNNPYAHFDRTQLCDALKAAKLPSDGPFPIDYSNFGVGLLGEVLACLYEKTWADLIAEKITGPLGMKDTVTLPDKSQRKRLAPPYDNDKKAQSWNLNALAGAGALRSTTADLTRFGRALLHPDKTPFPQAIKLLLQPHTPSGEIGLGIFLGKIDGQPIYEHSGGTGGYRSLFRLHPDSNQLQIVLINNTAIDAMEVVNATRPQIARKTDSTKVLTEQELDAFTGIYQDGPAAFTIIRHNDHLKARLSGQTFLKIHPHETTDRFFYKAVPAELQFTRDPATQKITTLTLFQNGREMPFKKSEDPIPTIKFRTDKELAPYTGTYTLLIGGEFQIQVLHNTLLAKLTGQTFLPVFETKDDWFDYDIIKASLQFERDAEGKITALYLHQNGLVQRAVKKP
ncbi:serine hydrolase [Phragmitibacter flavus]|uniref:Serine hydrolase n=1 Tax=Phragmitibacter flavus TaxID=2576071 RepID=A0A5R8KJV8_9BACT|nr:serine hydrolase [Phragmitibacter flavus]TLD72537.1 serine hydrolase [Phragmitibacter flavus]